MNARLDTRKDAKTLAIEEKLNGELVTVNAKDQPLGDYIQFLASYSGLNLVLDPAALAEEGLTNQSPVTMQANDIPLKAALKFVLQPKRLTYIIQDGVVLITNGTANRAEVYPVAYPVGDLVISPHSRQKQQQQGANPSMGNASPNGVDANGNPITPGGVMAPGLTNVPSPGLTDQNGTSIALLGRQEIDFEPLIALIKTAVAPGTWKDGPDDGGTGGGFGLGAGFGPGGGGELLGEETAQAVGSITPFYLNISLIIRHTAEVHDDIVDLLRQLRRLQDLQVSIEVRFINVDDSFFEQIGVDFDFSIQSDAYGRKSSFVTLNPAAVPVPAGAAGGGGGTGGGTTAVSPYLVNPAIDHSLGREPLIVGRQGNGDTGIGTLTPGLDIPFLQGSAGAITPFNALTANTGATFGLAFLSDLEVYLFLTAVQGDTRANLVQAPKVTTFNGAIASVSNFTNINFVQSVIPVVGAGAVAFQPNVQSLPDGVIMSVTPVVSADRRYVRMTLSPFFQTFVRFDTFSTQAAVGGGGLGGQATGISTQIQLPVTSVTNVSTTVTVPDGGTVLLGGVKRLREERREFGVPILAKTPLINRLFRNIGIGRQTSSLMLMVTPRIIILEEEEARLGIPNVNNVTF